MAKKKETTARMFFAGTHIEITEEMLPNMKEQFLANQDKAYAGLGYYRVGSENDPDVKKQKA